jgi:hypothetical protein
MKTTTNGEHERYAAAETGVLLLLLLLLELVCRRC